MKVRFKTLETCALDSSDHSVLGNIIATIQVVSRAVDSLMRETVNLIAQHEFSLLYFDQQLFIKYKSFIFFHCLTFKHFQIENLSSHSLFSHFSE